ncbi:MAG: peptide chain release factor 2 [Thermodesulfovibrionia bacterium]|nr:peptide chain release factor 2 [Thermodesulfovibrionia bacterium]
MPYGGIFEVPSLKGRLEVLQKELSAEGLWDDPSSAQKLLKERSGIENSLQPLFSIQKKLEDTSVLIELSEEEDGDVFGDDILRNIREIKAQLDDLELKSSFSAPEDINNAIMTIHPGAGGTESQDWAQMLMRMYLRWAERRNFKVSIIDIISGEEAGIKSATITIEGDYAYGYLKGEAGVHRLVRISPFDANKRRHTSFAAILVYPEITEDIEVDMNEDDIRVDTYRASGAGGQHVNKTDSAVRLTHIPTNVVVCCQNERSQIKNKAMAMKVLKARLYALKKEEHNKKIEDFMGEKKEIAWGSQIRSYTLQPYQLIKDHRTDIERGNVAAVLDGDIDEFIKGYLMKGKAGA